jgi:hypothetical protein
MSFSKWLKVLNKEVKSWGGPASYDMPPLDYRALFDEDYTPAEVSKMVEEIENGKPASDSPYYLESFED